MIAVFLRFIPPTLLRIGNDLPWNVATTWLPFIYELPTTCLSICLMPIFLRFISLTLPRLGNDLACDVATTWLPIVYELPLTTALWLAYNVATICLRLGNHLLYDVATVKRSTYDFAMNTLLLTLRLGCDLPTSCLTIFLMIAIFLRFISPNLLRLYLQRAYDVVTTYIGNSLRLWFAYNMATICIRLAYELPYELHLDFATTFFNTWLYFVYDLVTCTTYSC